MLKIPLFRLVIISLFLFTLSFAVARSEAGEIGGIENWDVYYKKTKVFRDWNKKESHIAGLSKKLLLLSAVQIAKGKKIKIKPTIKPSTEPGNKLLINLLHGVVKLTPQKSTRKISKLMAADVFLRLSIKPAKLAKKRGFKSESKRKIFIFGNRFEKNCYWQKKDCGFNIDIPINQYNKKMTPPKHRIDTAHFPIDF